MPSMARGANRDASMRCTTSTPSAMTRPLPVGRSGLRSTLLRSRKSSSRGSAGSVDVDHVAAGSRAFVDDRRHQVGGAQQGAALLGIECGEPLRQPLLTGAALGLDQVRRRPVTPTPAPGGRRRDVRCAQQVRARPAKRSPASSTADGPVRASAKPPGVIGPSLASVESADNCDSETWDSGRRKRNWRASRTTASERSLARRPSGSFTRQRVHSGTEETWPSMR